MRLSTAGLTVLVFFVLLPTNIILLVIVGADLIMRRLIIAMETVAKAIKSRCVLKSIKTSQ